MDELKVRHVATAIKDALGRAMNARPLLGDTESGDWYAEGGTIDLEEIARHVLLEIERYDAR